MSLINFYKAEDYFISSRGKIGRKMGKTLPTKLICGLFTDAPTGTYKRVFHKVER